MLFSGKRCQQIQTIVDKAPAKTEEGLLEWAGSGAACDQEKGLKTALDDYL